MLPTTFRSFRTLALAAIASAAVAATPVLPAQTAQQSLAVTRITQPVDNARLVTLKGNVHPLAQARFDHGAAPVSMNTGRMMLVLKPSSLQKQALKQYVDALQDPSSPNYHKWITPAEFGARYGVTDSDLQTIQAWLQSQGFAVEKVSQARNVIQFSGTIGQVQSAFHTAIHQYQVNGAMHLANATDPQIPAALSSVVAGVAPLNDFRPRPHGVFGGIGKYDAASKRIKPNYNQFDNNNNPYLYVVPADAATIYNTPNANLNANFSGSTTYDGTGATIGIAGDSKFAMQDVQNYRTAFLGETSATAKLPNVIIDGNDPGINGDAGEALLDVEIAGGLAPKAQINFYVADSTDLQSGLFLAAIRAIDDNAIDILNVSFGGCEAAQGDTFNQFIYLLWQQAAAQGISVTVSTGDNGSAGCDNDNTETQAQFGLAVNGIASTPYNIAVGGTDYDILLSSATAFDKYVTTTDSHGNLTSGSAPYYGTAKSYIPEATWNNSTTNNTTISANQPYKDSNSNTNITAASGGVSGCVTTSGNNCTGGWAKPAFQIFPQSSPIQTPNDGLRDLPDVSFLAANGLYGALWAVCADNIANQDTSNGTYTDCQTTNGQINSNTTVSGYGGTSASAPAFAGMLALVKQKTGTRLGQANNIIYQLASSMYSTVFHDVAPGNSTGGNISVPCKSGSQDCGSNGFLNGYNTGSGYDLATGLGSVNVAQMVNNWSSVALASTSTSLQINSSTTGPVSAVHGQSLNFAVSVSPTAAAGDVGLINSASGASLFAQNGKTVLTLSGGKASTTYNGLPGGTYTVYGYYGGDTSHAANQSNGVAVNISAEGSTTALSVNSYDATTGNPLSGTSIPYGSFVVANAQPYGTAEGQSNTLGIATGNVTFSGLGSSSITTKINSTGIASVVSPSNSFATALTPGSYSVSATYAGDASYHSSLPSGTVSFSVVKGATTTGVDPATTTVASNGSVQLTVTVTTDSIGAFPSQAFSVTSGGANVTNYTISSFQTGYVGSTVAAQAVITIPASSLTAAVTDAPIRPSRRNLLTATGGAVLACVLFFGIPARRRSWRVMLGLLVVLVTMAGIGCGGGNNNGGGGGGGGKSHSVTVTFTGDTNYNTSSGTSTVTVN